MGRAGVHADRARPEAGLTPPRRIGILGHVGNRNLGDEAIIAAVIQGIRDRIADADLVAFTTRPEDTRARHGIASFPLRRGAGSPPAPPAPPGAATGPGSGGNESPGSGGRLVGALRRVPGLRALAGGTRGVVEWVSGSVAEMAFWAERYRRMRRVDLLIIAGSNQLSDYVGGPWGFPYTIFAWSAAARLAGARVAFLSIGAGPVRSFLSGHFIRTALGWAAYRSYRDVGSRDTVQALGVAGPHTVAPDLAHGLRFQAPARASSTPTGSRTVVVNPLPYFDPRFWAESDSCVYARYVELLAAFAARLLDQGRRVHFIATQLRADPPVIADIVRALERSPSTAAAAAGVHPSVSSFEDLVARLEEADLVVATRFHGVVLAQMLGKPTVGIAYRRSTTDLLEDVGQGAYSIEIGALTLEGLWDRLTALEKDEGAARRIAARLEEYRRALDAQYDLVLGAPARGGAPPAPAG